MKQYQERNRVETHARRNTLQECLQGTCASEKRKVDEGKFAIDL